MLNRSIILPFCALLALLLIAITAYASGLYGSFLFDDFGNLPILGATGPIDNWPTFWRYITSGTADPTGRPLTLLTFLIDARNWPAHPYPFKRTNLILHLINGVLLALLLRRLGRDTFKAVDLRRIDLAAVMGAGFWLVHPLFVSTTLYIVQREAMLPASFTLLGLLAWLQGRRAMKRGHRLGGSLWIALGLGGCTLLGVLSKANGILLPTLALVVEYVLLRVGAMRRTLTPPTRPDRVYKRVMLLLAWLPTALVTAYLLQQGWSGLTRGISSVRPWTLGQRLLTEPRVLLDYLDLLWLPRPFTPGLFNDHIQASTSLWSPTTTLPSLLAIMTMIVAAWLLRHRWPAAALATLFYFVGQSLESSTIALELYFEHRNYLPAMLMFWPLALWLCDVRLQPAVGPAVALVATETIPVEASATSVSARFVRNKAKLALAMLILSGLALMTHARASLWGNSHDQALLWARLNPDSPRAQANAAQTELNDGQPARAVSRLLAPLTKAPDQVQLALNLFGAQCQLGRIDPSTLNASRLALSTTRDPGTLLVSWFERAMEQVANPPCPQLSFATLSSLLEAALANPYLASNPGRQQDIHYLQGRLALMQGDADTALAEFNRALDLQVRTSMALKQAALLGSSGFPQQGLSHLDHLEAEPQQGYSPGFGMPRIHDWVLQHQQYWPKELARLRATLRDDATHQKHTAE
ncbi:tetratricopeptide repeat protein [Rhodanobacter terrae]|uniref:Tetratricopeptide repeat protein n=1 Tax=Rhodanobacter terrae TaxID=418647 RepID=A0ABW0ST86_9GAMM